MRSPAGACSHTRILSFSTFLFRLHIDVPPKQVQRQRHWLQERQGQEFGTPWSKVLGFGRHQQQKNAREILAIFRFNQEERTDVGEKYGIWNFNLFFANCKKLETLMCQMRNRKQNGKTTTTRRRWRLLGTVTQRLTVDLDQECSSRQRVNM